MRSIFDTLQPRLALQQSHSVRQSAFQSDSRGLVEHGRCAVCLEPGTAYGCKHRPARTWIESLASSLRVQKSETCAEILSLVQVRDVISGKLRTRSLLAREYIPEVMELAIGGRT